MPMNDLRNAIERIKNATGIRTEFSCLNCICRNCKQWMKCRECGECGLCLVAVCSEYRPIIKKFIIESTPIYGKRPLYDYWVKLIEKFGKPERITSHPNPLPQGARGSAEKEKTFVIMDDISGGPHVD